MATDTSSRRGRGEHERRQLDEPARRDLAAVDRPGDFERCLEAEVRGNRLLEARGRATTVAAAGCGGQRREADVVARRPSLR